VANQPPQFVGLLLHLTHSLRFHGEIATQFRDLAFDHIRPFGRLRPPA
jgi:hypothetical protein